MIIMVTGATAGFGGKSITRRFIANGQKCELLPVVKSACEDAEGRAADNLYNR